VPVEPDESAPTLTPTESPAPTVVDDEMPTLGFTNGAVRRGMGPGEVVAGRYRLVEPLGKGGMGEVWLAEQEKPVRRQVAFKVIKRGMDSEQIVARFEAERQALALMDHPAVAKVFDAGTTPGGRPFFVMEYVVGSPMTDFCDERRMTTHERLQLFQQVCGGVQHAHQKALIHRDLKPSNVLVSLQDGEPSPKIIDFGIAKATGDQPAGGSLQTQVGMVVGTPAYMSPEQARGEPVDTRADVYSLGVMLYELLIGRTTFDAEALAGEGYDSLRRKICEDEPPRPSTRFHSLGDERTDSAERRRTVASTLESELKGDLDWITMKALEKEPARRYDSPAELAADIEAYLDHRPVVARPPSTAYKAGKFIRRHRWGVGLGLSLTLALIAGVIGTGTGMLRARLAARKAQAVTTHLLDILSEANPEKAQGRSVTVLEAMAASEEKVAESFVGQPELEMEVRATIGLVYHEQGAYEQAESNLRRAAELAGAELGARHLFTVGVRGKLARTLVEAGRYDDAEGEMQQLLPIFASVYGDRHDETLSMMHNLAAIYLHREDYERAEPLLLDVVAARGETLGEDHADTQASAGNLAQLYMFTERFDQAEPLLSAGVRVRRHELGDRHPRTLISVFNLGDLYHRMGRDERAEPLIREALAGFRDVVGDDHPYTLETLGTLAQTLQALGQLKEAEELAVANHELRSGRFGADHALTLDASRLLAEIREGLGSAGEPSVH
jgi:non-specific serine/threonine protein kinase/serine/threonine-protein kinase